MKTIIASLVLAASFAASAQVLECHQRLGKHDVHPDVVGTLVLNDSEATFVSASGETSTFAFAETLSTRTGSWLKFSSATATLTVEASSSVRRTQIDVEKENGVLVSSLSLKCLE